MLDCVSAATHSFSRDQGTQQYCIKIKAVEHGLMLMAFITQIAPAQRRLGQLKLLKLKTTLSLTAPTIQTTLNITTTSSTTASKVSTLWILNFACVMHIFFASLVFLGLKFSLALLLRISDHRPRVLVRRPRFLECRAYCHIRGEVIGL